MITTINNKHNKLNVPNKREQNQTCLYSDEREGLRPKGNVPNLRFPEFQGEWEKCTFDKIAQYKKGPFGSALKKDIFVPQSKDTIKVYEQQNAIKKDWTLSRYYITKGYFNSHMKQFVAKAGDLIVSCAGTIGEIYELPQDAEEGVFNQALMRVQVNDEAVNKEIFITVFSSMIDKFSKIYSNGSAIKNIPPFADLKKTQVFLPCKEEQKKIAKLLVLLDERIATQNKIIDKLQTLIKGIRHNIFKDIQGEVLALGNIADVYQPQTISSSDLTTDGYWVYGANGIIGKYKEYNHETEQICITCRGNTCGTVNYTQPKVWITGNSMVINTDKHQQQVNKRYLFHYLSSYNFNSIVSGSGQPQIVRTPLEKIKVTLPSIEKQVQIAHGIDLILTKIETECTVLGFLESQKQYLLRQMFI